MAPPQPRSITAQAGSSVNLLGTKILYAATALAAYEGNVSGSGLVVSHVDLVGRVHGGALALNGQFSSAQQLLAVSSGAASLRGSASAVAEPKWIQACAWESKLCHVDATYVDWGTLGPRHFDGTPKVCGSVETSPWVGEPAGSLRDFFATPNCDGSQFRLEDDLSTAQSYSSQRLAVNRPRFLAASF